MECLGCNLVSASPVLLRTGKIVCSSCEAWRHECEARHVLTRKNKAIKEYLEGVRAKRGIDASVSLRNEMIALRASLEYNCAAP